MSDTAPNAVATPRDRDGGAATIFVILATFSIFVGAGFAIDVGQYVVAARSSQNTADATALAVATDCALSGAPIADYSPYRQSDQTTSAAFCGSGQTTVTATQTVDGLFLRQSQGDVERSATARWGTLGRATTAPIVISDCEFSEALLDGTADITLYLDDTRPQTGCSSLPGGFSQLHTSVDCAVDIAAGGYADGSPGADLQKIVPCITSPTSPSLPHDIVIPIYDSATCHAEGCNGRGPYLIPGFAAFRVTGYSLNGNNNAGSLGRNCPDQSRGRYCIRGDFIRYTTSTGNPGPGTDFGVTQVYLAS